MPFSGAGRATLTPALISWERAEVWVYRFDQARCQRPWSRAGAASDSPGHPVRDGWPTDEVVSRSATTDRRGSRIARAQGDPRSRFFDDSGAENSTSSTRGGASHGLDGPSGAAATRRLRPFLVTLIAVVVAPASPAPETR